MSLIGLTSAAQGLKLKNGGGMKIRIAKKTLKKVISDAYQINKRRVKLKRMDDLFSRRYGYSKSGLFFTSYIRAPKTKKSMSLKKGLRSTIDAILGEDKAEDKPAKKRKRSKVQH